MIKAYGMVYLTEDDMSNPEIHGKYLMVDSLDWTKQVEQGYFTKQLALPCKHHTVTVGKGIYARTEEFSTSGMTRAEKRKAMYKRKINTRGYPSGFGARNKPTAV